MPTMLMSIETWAIVGMMVIQWRELMRVRELYLRVPMLMLCRWGGWSDVRRTTKHSPEHGPDGHTEDHERVSYDGDHADVLESG